MNKKIAVFLCYSIKLENKEFFYRDRSKYPSLGKMMNRFSAQFILPSVCQIPFKALKKLQ